MKKTKTITLWCILLCSFLWSGYGMNNKTFPDDCTETEVEAAAFRITNIKVKKQDNDLNMGTVEIEVKGGDPNFTFKIIGSTNDQKVSSSNTETFTNLKYGDYKVEVKDNNNTTATGSFTIELIPSIDSFSINDRDGVSRTTARAGVGDIITIVGYGFGDQRENPDTGYKGQIHFAGETLGGTNSLRRIRKNDDVDYLVSKDNNGTISEFWTNRTIKIKCPSSVDSEKITSSNGVIELPSAATGYISVENYFGDIVNSTTDLIVDYSISNYLDDRDFPHHKYPQPIVKKNNLNGYVFHIGDNLKNNHEAIFTIEKVLRDWSCALGITLEIKRKDNTGEIDFAISKSEKNDGKNIIYINNNIGDRHGFSGINSNGCTGLFSDVDNDFDYKSFGYAYNADIAISTKNVQLSIIDSYMPGKIDLYSIVAHEIGHILSLGHIVDPNEIMHHSTKPQRLTINSNSKTLNAANYIVDYSRLIDFTSTCGDQWSVNPLSFTLNKDSGCNDNIITDFQVSQVVGDKNKIQYSDLSEGGTIKSWYWQFEGGTPSFSFSKTPPIVEYPRNGNYEVTLIVNGDIQKRKTSNVKVSKDDQCTNPKAQNRKSSDCIDVSFNYNPNQNITVGQEIQFTADVSGGTGTLRYEWDFGDGNKQYVANPKHVFTSSGAPDVTLSVRDDASPDPIVVAKQVIVSDDSATGNPVNFTANVTSGPAPLTVSFTGPNSPNIKSYSWTFYKGSDGGFEYSDQQNSTITYGDWGDYSVELEIEYTNGQVFTSYKENYINVGYPKPPYSIEIESACNSNDFINNITPCNNSYLPNDFIYFTARDIFGSFGTPVSWSWDFGDGNTKTDTGLVSIVSNAFDKGGSKTITVTSTNTEGQTATASKTIFITDTDPSIEAYFVKSKYDLRYTSGPTTFTDNSIIKNIAPDKLEYFWDFGKGASPKTATTKGPHQVCYDGDTPAGYRDVSLTVSARVNGINLRDNIKEPNAVYVTEGGNLFECGKGCEFNVTDISVDKLNKYGTKAVCLSDSPTLYVISRSPGSECNLGWTVRDLNGDAFNDRIIARREIVNFQEIVDCRFDLGKGYNCVQEDFNYRQFEALPLRAYIEERIKRTGESYPITLDLEIRLNNITAPADAKTYRIETIIDNPNLDVQTSQNACLEQSLELWPDRVAHPNEEYLWTANNPTLLSYLSATNIPNPIFTRLTGVGEHTYNLKVTNTQTGCSDSKYITINVGGQVIEDKKFFIKTNEPQSLEVPMFISGNTPKNYSWVPSDHLSNPNIANPIFSVSNSGIYDYTLTVTDEIGCSTITNIRVEAIAPDDCDRIYNGDLIVTNLNQAWEANQYCVINGNLIVEDDPNTSDIEDNGVTIYRDIKHLRSLSNIKRIQGNLIIKNTPLDTYQAFEKLEYIGGNFIIKNCRTSGRGFIKLNKIEGHLAIEDNSLIDVTALFGSLTSVKKISINNNITLESALRLPNLKSVLEGITISNNGNLFRITNMDALEEVGPLMISNNPRLDHITDFLKLTTLEGDLKIDNNPKLRWVGLTKLEDVNGDLLITDNEVLQNIIGTNQLSSIRGKLNLYGNPSLKDACALSYVLEVPGRIGSYQTDIRDNGNTTSTADDIINNCNNGCEYNGDLVIDSQQQVDNFRYCKINGNLTIIQESYDPAIGWRLIENLQGLSVLEEVNGNFKILNTSLSSLHGLSNLLKIGGNLEIKNNEYLNDACDILYLLENENAVIGNKEISQNGITTSSVNNIRYYCNVSSCENVYNGNLVLDSQEKVDEFNYCSVNGDLIIDEYNGSITNIDALSLLTKVTNGSLIIRTNSQLTNLDGLRNLEFVSGALKIENNNSITSLEGLSNLHYVQSIIIRNNQNLLNLKLYGLSNLAGVSTLSMNGNSTLESACSIVNLIKDPKHARYIYSNGPNTSNTQIIVDNCSAVNCVYEGDLILESQLQIDAFKYCEINGSLTIDGSSSNSYIFDLTPLLSLNKIKDNLTIINNKDLTNLNGLQNLTFIGGDVSLRNNTILTNVDYLSGINEIKGNFTLGGNSNLYSIDGLSKLVRIEGTFSLDKNKLTNLKGLSSLTSIGGRFLLFQSNLSNLDGLSSLTSIGNAIQIIENPLLTNVDGLSGITSVSGSIGRLDIRENPGLENLDGLRNIISISENLDLSYNTRIQNACGIIQLLENPNSVGGIINISNNGYSSSSPEAITENCNPCLYPDTVILKDQEVVDRFNYCEIKGNLIIQSGDSEPITNLNGLSSLEKIYGNLTIYYNKELINIDGLENLTTVTGDIQIYNNSKLENVNGFRNLTNFSGKLEIESNFELLHLDGFSGLTSIKGGLILLENGSLESVSGLSSVASVENGVIIDSNNLQNLDGLQNLKNVKGGFSLVYNRSLENACAIVELLSTPGAISGNISIGNNGPTTSLVQDILDSCSPCNEVHPENNVILSSQAQINAFDYCEIKGNLTIDDTAGDITDLSNLSKLETLGGGLYIKNNSGITNLDAFTNLTLINGSLEISNNASLADLGGLSNITNISGNINIYRNNKILSLSAFNNLTTLQGNLTISWNNGLTDLDGFINLSQISGSLEIKGNDYLSTVNGFSNLTKIIKDFRIINNNLANLSGFARLSSVKSLVFNNANLTNLDDLSNIQEIRGGLYLYGNSKLQNIQGLSSLVLGDIGLLHVLGNPLLEDLSGLENLQSVRVEVRVVNNQNLVDVDGLSGLESIAKKLEINNNSNLENACGIIKLLENPDAVGGILVIKNNGPNASSELQIKEYCTGDVQLLRTSNTDLSKKVTNEIMLYPNPVVDELHIQSKRTITEVTIFNYTGAIIYSSNVIKTNKHTIERMDYPAGVYFVQINTDQKSTMKKIVIE
ncbi:PKD domain-containing protein [uncultured Aquimarina sp.]|uniref:PKD domain-containing protein n=1 Tax=uncultured Aquimarina sp. TaxID=575652 RepID=UPI002601E005|nr:PKD domain-containing protein [uncultured Aquimarina sp.]